MILNQHDIEKMERRYRANLINSLGGFKSLVLVGTRSPVGNENLATFSSLFHLGANPALCGIIVRPATPGENTLGNILSSGFYTLNQVHPEILEAAHQCSAQYPEGVSEFEQTGLNAEYREGIPAPYVRESRVKFACELVQQVPIELNRTTLLIGKIIQVVLPENIVGMDGFIDLEAAETITCSGLDSYHLTSGIGRKVYARPGE